MRRLLLIVLVVALGAGAYAAFGGRPSGSAGGKKVLVLGFDGMDPRMVRRLIDEGRMPNFSKLEKQGGFEPLTTSIPPQSPVAWSNFITGAGPGVHGIFDFIHRDPETLAPYSSTSIDEPGDDSMFTIPLGDYKLESAELNPFADTGSTKLAHRGIPFWDKLDERGIPVQMYRLPANYPPSESKHGHMCCLSGMGVPDVMSTQGTYQHFTTRPRRARDDLGGGMQFRLRRNFKTKAYVANVRSIPNHYAKSDSPEASYMTLEVAVHPDPDKDIAKIVYTNKSPVGLPDEEVAIVLNAGEWSDWTEMHFLQTPVGPSFPCIARFYLQSVRPDINLYVTPLNFSPTSPAAAISEPPDFVVDIGKAIGNFWTQGFAEDFKARDQKVFNDAEYKVQADLVLEERFRLMDYALDNFEDGLLFFYFSSSDLQAHIFYWDSDDPHPVRTPEEAKKYHKVVEDVYVRMDDALGKCMERLGEDTTILVMSDHGFCNFKRGFGLTTWLFENGYLDLDPELGTFRNDETRWRKTRAYGLGINGLYLNLKGREKYGVVEPFEKEALLDELTEKLLAVRDDGKPVIKRVYRTDEWYKGPEAANAPDLIIGYCRDYRASWQTCLGDCDRVKNDDGEKELSFLVNNTKAWSADHCIAHDEVPGVLLSNRKLVKDQPSLIDVAPTILAEFGVDQPEGMTGKSVFER